MTTEADLRGRVATMCRMLNRQGSIGMFGHVSIREAGTSRVFISPGAGSDKGAVLPEHVFLFDLDGTILQHPGGEVPLEWRIHTQIHADRPDAMCVVHLHARYATLLGIAGRDLEPVFLHGSFLQSGVPTWDEPRLVLDMDQAASLSRTLGGSVAVQMRGHGTVVVGDTPESAFFACTFLEENARNQVEAGAIGGAIRLSERDAIDCAKGTRNERLFRLLWEYHARRT